MSKQHKYNPAQHLWSSSKGLLEKVTEKISLEAAMRNK